MSRTLVSYDIFCVQQIDRIRRKLGLQHQPAVNLHGTVRASQENDHDAIDRWYEDRRKERSPRGF